MKITKIFAARQIIGIHFLTAFILFLTINGNGISGKSSDPKTKLILQNIRMQLSKKAEEAKFRQQNECKSETAPCMAPTKKADEDRKKNEKIRYNFENEKKPGKPTEKIGVKNVVRDAETRASNIRRGQEKWRIEKATEEGGKNKKEEKKSRTMNEKKSNSEKAKLDFTKKKTIRSKIEFQPAKIENEFEGKKSKNKTRSKSGKFEMGKEKNTGEKNNEKSGKIEVRESGKFSNEKSDFESGNERENFAIPSGPFFFSINSNTDTNAAFCTKHKNIYMKQLKKYKIWALMMFDASAKLPSGILQGNLNQFGDFDECLSINAIFKKSKSNEPPGIKGKYCLAEFDITTDLETGNIRKILERIKSFSFIKSNVNDGGHFIPKFSSIKWGLCVPDTCPAEDVEKMIKYQLRYQLNVTESLSINVKVEEENCVVKDDLKFELNSTVLIALSFYGAVIATAIYATCSDLKAETKFKKLSENERVEKELEEASKDISFDEKISPEPTTIPSAIPSSEGTIKNLLMAFSLKESLTKLLEEAHEESIGCIYGIKSIFSLMLYLAHKTIPLGWTSFSNRIFLTMMSNHPSTMLLRTSVMYTDSFLLMNGLVTTYDLSKEIAAGGKISWTRAIAARFVRLTPILLAILTFYAFVWDKLGSGPLWNVLVKGNSRLCRKYMWRNLLYVQNFFAFENMCAPHTYQLAIDMQLSLFAPLFVYLLHKHGKVGFGVLQALFLLSSIARYVTASNNELSTVPYHGIPLSQLLRTTDLLHSQTLHRASPYLLGAIIGHYLQKYKGQIRIPRFFAAACWIVSFSVGFYTTVYPTYATGKEFEYDSTEAAKYAALSPVAWSIALGWVIAACHMGLGGKLNEILCCKAFLIFGRISYSFYLTQFLVFFYNVGVKRIPEMFSLSGSFDSTEFAAVLFISIWATLLFDIPMLKIEKIVLKKWPTNFEIILKASDANELENYDKSGRKFANEKNRLQGEVKKENPCKKIEKQIENVFDGKTNESPDEEEEEKYDCDDYDYDEDGINENNWDESDEDEMYQMGQPLRRSHRMRFRDGR